METFGRPWWVRTFLREHTKRIMAIGQVSMFLVISALGWIITSFEYSSDTELGKYAMTIGLIVAVLGLASAIWCRLAIRWVDRNGKWAFNSTHDTNAR